MSHLSVGDLAILVRSCCKKTSAGIGKIGTIQFVKEMETLCRGCNTHHKGLHAALHARAVGGPIHWAKRIPPLEELDDVKKDEEITA